MRRRLVALILLFLFTGCATELQLMKLNMEHERAMKNLEVQEKKYQAEVEKQYTLQRLELQEKEKDRALERDNLNQELELKKKELEIKEQEYENNSLFN